MSQAPVFLVGGSGLFRRGLSGFLEESAFRPTAEFDRYQDCVDHRGRCDDPEIIIYISSGVVEESGDAVDALRRAYRPARVLVLSSDLSIEELGACLRVGTAGYLLSDVSRDVLIHSLTLVRLGETVFPSGLAAAWVNGRLSQTPMPDPHRMRALTRRETDILECLTQGASNKLIARRLGIGEPTVKIHVKSLIRKLGVRNRTQAALWAVKAGLGEDGAFPAA